MIMAYLYQKKRSPYWYVQYLDSERKRHDKSTGLRANDPNDTVKAKILRAELEAKEYQRMPVVNGAAWDTWVPKFLVRHCQTRETFVRYEDAWKWIALWLQRQRIHAPRQLTYRLGVEYVDWRTNFKKRGCVVHKPERARAEQREQHGRRGASRHGAKRVLVPAGGNAGHRR